MLISIIFVNINAHIRTCNIIIRIDCGSSLDSLGLAGAPGTGRRAPGTGHRAPGPAARSGRPSNDHF